MAKAKLLGLIIDRREVGDVGAFDHLTDEELMREAEKKARELGLCVQPLKDAENIRIWRYHNGDCCIARKTCHFVAMNDADDSSHASDAGVGIG